MRKYIHFMIMGSLFAFGAGCGSSGNKDGGGEDGGVDCGAAPVELCTTPDTEVTLPTDINVDTNLDSDCTYRLEDKVFVTACTLSIEAGTTVLGDNETALIVTQNGKIDAVGTANDPIVFTSSVAEGDREPADWGGVVLLGKASLSWGNAECDGTLGACVANIEGLSALEEEGLYGGDDDTHDCGTINYARIEFAGFTIGTDNELNGLTVGGCGSDTELSYIQVHRGEDDGVEFFGGTASIDHFVISGPGDDGLDWDQGWRGNAQFFIVHQFAGKSDDPRGIEADNNGNAPAVEPRSEPSVSCGTIVHDGNGLADRGVLLRRGTLGTLDQLIIAGFPSAGFDIRDEDETVVNLEDDWPESLVLENSYLFDNDPDYGQGESDDEKDEDFPEPARAGDAARNNTTGTDPDFGDISGAVDGLSTPDYVADSISDAGAFCNTTTDWTEDWTSFPQD